MHKYRVFTSLIILALLPAICYSATEKENTYPTEAKRFLDLGNSYSEQEQYKKAIAAYDQSLKLHSHANTYVARGMARYSLGNFEQAFNDFDRAVASAPTQSRPYCFRGFCRADRKEFNKAITDLTKAIELASSAERKAQAYSLRAMVWEYQLENSDLAIADIDNAIKLAPDKDVYHFCKCKSLFSLNKGDKALIELKRFLETNPRNISACSFCGMLYFLKEDFASSQKYFERAYQIDPTDPKANTSLVMLFAISPDKEFRDYIRAIQLAHDWCEATKWKNWESLNLLARAHAESGNFKEAIKWESQALKVAPKQKKTSIQKFLNSYKEGVIEKTVSLSVDMPLISITD